MSKWFLMLIVMFRFSEFVITFCFVFCCCCFSGDLDYAFSVEMHTDLSQKNEETLRLSVRFKFLLSVEFLFISAI